MTPPQGRPVLRRSDHLLAALFGGLLSLMTGAVALLLGHIALHNHRERVLYEEQAVVATAVITGFETRSSRGRGNAVINSTAPVVEFGVDGRTVRCRVLLAQPVFPSQREARVGRSIEVRYPAGWPDRAIASDAIGLLPSVAGWAFASLFMLCLAVTCLYLAAGEALKALRYRRAPAG